MEIEYEVYKITDFCLFDSLCAINNLSVTKERVFLG